MALVVENGLGLVNAESYISVAEADAYHLAMGNTAWTGSADVKEAALRRATQYIDARYTFKGERLSAAQALAWPRTTFYIGFQLFAWPIQNLKAATAELALRALAGPLFTDADTRTVIQETVGPISVTYADNGSGSQVRYTVVEDLLKPLLFRSAGGSLRVERA